ncbi:MAG: SRPBCC family protein [Marmoricola sp.]
MLTVEESVTIDKPRAEVSAFFADPDNVPVYSSNLVDYEVVSGGPTEIGRRAKFAVKVVGVRLDYTDELVEYVEGERAKLVSRDGKIPYSITLTFSDEGSGTKVTWLQESESLGGVFKLADGLVMKMYSRDVRSNLEKAKTLLEA